jgi:predicted dehydrogenase
MGVRHALAYALLCARDPSMELSAVFDNDGSAAQFLVDRVAAESNSRPLVSDSWQQLIDVVDVVDIVLPTSLHASFAAEAIKAGRHVLIAKPLSLTVEEAEQIVELARTAGVSVAVAENFRRMPGNRALRELLTKRRGDSPIFMQSRVTHSSFGEVGSAGPHWYTDPQVSGSYPIFELGAHEFDLIDYLLGPIERVYAHALQDIPDAGSASTVLVSLTSHGQAFSQVAIHITPADYASAAREIVFDGGEIISRRWESWEDGYFQPIPGERRESDEMIREFVRAGSWPRHHPELGVKLSRLSIDRNDPLLYGVTETLGDFITAVRSGGVAEVDASGGLRTVAVCQAVIQSTQTGSPVDVVELLHRNGTVQNKRNSRAKR